MFIEGQIIELEQQISNLLKQTNQIITIISGIWETLGATIISEIGDINRDLANLPNLLRLPALMLK